MTTQLFRLNIFIYSERYIFLIIILLIVYNTKGTQKNKIYTQLNLNL